MRLNQDLIQRMFDGRGGAAGGGSSLDPGLIAGLATEMWTEENYVSKTFFNELFVIHKKTTTTVYDGDTVVSTTTDTSGTFAPNEIPSQEESTDEETGYRTVVVTEVDNIEAKKGLWTDFFLSALGLNGSGGGGGIGDVTWQALGDNTDTRQIASSHLTTALSTALTGYATQSWVTAQNYVTSSAISDMATKTWVNNQSFVNWTALGDGTTTQQIALSHLTTALSGYATQNWVTNNFSTPSTVATQLQTYAKIQNGTITIGDTSLTPITSVTGTFWGKSFTNGGTVNGTIKAGSSGGAIEQFESIELNSAGTLTNYGGFIDFHFCAPNETFNPSIDYTSRIIEDGSGVISISARSNTTGSAVLAGLRIGSGYEGSYVQIGNVRLVYDSTNNALKVVGSDGSTAANFYATGSVSALGYGAGGGGGTGDVTWTNLADNSDTRPIALSHIQNALSGYATTSQLAGYLPLTGGTMTGVIYFGDNVSHLANTSIHARIGEFDDHKGAVVIQLGTGDTSLSNNYPRFDIINKEWNLSLFSVGIDSNPYNSQGYSLKSGARYGTFGDQPRYENTVPYVISTTSTSNNHWKFAAGDATGGVLLGVASGVGQIGTYNYTDLIFHCGKVGVGTTSPSYKLHVDGTFCATSVAVTNGTSSQFLKADGTVDSNTYALSSSLADYLPLTAGSTKPLTGNLHIHCNNNQGLIIKTTQNTVSYLTTYSSDDKNANFGFIAGSAYGVADSGGAHISCNSNGNAGGLFVNGTGLYYTNDLTDFDKYKVWTENNDGTGSGLDADLLDGQHGSYYATASSLSGYLPLTAGVANPITGILRLELDYSKDIEIKNTDGKFNAIRFFNSSGAGKGTIHFFYTYENASNELNITSETDGLVTLGYWRNPSLVVTNSGSTTTNGMVGICTKNPSYALHVVGSVYATSIIKASGTSAEFLKADGSVDTNSYALASSLSNYLPLAGGTMTGAIFFGDGSANGQNTSTHARIGEFDHTGGIVIQLGNNTDTHGRFEVINKAWNKALLSVGVDTNTYNTQGYMVGSGARFGTFGDLARYENSVPYVISTTGTSNNNWKFAAGDNTGGVLLGVASGVGYIGTYGNTNLIFNCGNVGVGESSPACKFHVSGSIKSSTSSQFGNVMIGGNSLGALDNNACIEMLTGTGYIDWHYQGSSSDYTSRIIENASGRICINNTLYANLNGNVSIGTTSASYKLHVDGSFYNSGDTLLGSNVSNTTTVYHKMVVGETNYTNNPYIQIGMIRLVYNNTDNAIRVVRSDGTAANLYATGGISALGYQSGGGGGGSTGVFSTSITPDTTGTYDLGTSTYKWRNLYLAGANGGNGFSIITSYSSYVYIGSLNKILFGADVEFEDTAYVENRMGIGVKNGNYDLYVNGENEGNAYFAGDVSVASLTNRSDMRLKDVVGDVNLSVQQIASAPTFKFRFKEKAKRTMVGTSAQYWDAVLPESVTRDADGILGLDYGVTALVSTIILAKGMTEHERRITKLEKENAELRARIKDLEEN